jgi:hypothetical protein
MVFFSTLTQEGEPPRPIPPKCFLNRLNSTLNLKSLAADRLISFSSSATLAALTFASDSSTAADSPRHSDDKTKVSTPTLQMFVLQRRPRQNRHQLLRLLVQTFLLSESVIPPLPLSPPQKTFLYYPCSLSPSASALFPAIRIFPS